MNLLHYGLQRSGTNYLKALVEKKYRVHFLNSNKDRSSPLQKHFRLYDNKNIIPEIQYGNDLIIKDFEDFERHLTVAPDYYLVISKDPYSWFLSYSSWARKCNWPAVSHHYIEEYNLFYKKWLDFSGQSGKIVFIKYIDLLRDLDSELDRLETIMKLQKKWLAGLISGRVGRVSQSRLFTEARKAYYLDEKYLEEYSEESLQELNNAVDPQVIALLGYEKRGLVK